MSHTLILSIFFGHFDNKIDSWKFILDNTMISLSPTLCTPHTSDAINFVQTMCCYCCKLCKLLVLNFEVIL